MTEKTLTTENIKPALDALRGELAPWPVVAMKQDRLNDTQKSAVNSGITSGLVAQIIANTAAIRALESAITGTGLRALVVASLPAVGTTGILYIVPVTTYDPDTDADVVNYSNEYIWIPVEGGQASEGHYEQVGQTGIVINNGQLTITVNGTSVGTFTANQSGDTTAAITVPTNADYVDRTTAQTAAGVKTFSDGIVGNVTGNVTGDLTGTASKAIADEDGTSIKSGYVNVAGTQTVTGDKSFTGSNTFNNILPNATNTYSLGSSSYQWSSVYAQTYYYNGTAWGLDKANVWTQPQTFNADTIYRSTVKRGTAPGSVVYMEFADYKDSSNNRFSLIGASYTTAKASDCCIYAYKTTVATGNAIGKIGIGCDSSGNVYTIAPTPASSDNSTQIATTAYVKSQGYLALNGLNPGALSLPNYADTVALDTTDWSKTGGMIVYTPTFDGWLQITIPNDEDGEGVKSNYISILDSGTSPLTGFSVSNILGPRLYFLYPVRASRVYWLYIKSYSEIITAARLVKCMGNV